MNDDGQPVGIVSQRDLFLIALVRALGFGAVAADKAKGDLVVKEVMTSDVATTTPETRLSEAATLMPEPKIGCLPVLDGGQIVGILTGGHFVAAAANGATDLPGTHRLRDKSGATGGFPAPAPFRAVD